jgi:hypothetical protein
MTFKSSQHPASVAFADKPLATEANHAASSAKPAPAAAGLVLENGKSNYKDKPTDVQGLTGSLHIKAKPRILSPDKPRSRSAFPVARFDLSVLVPEYVFSGFAQFRPVWLATKGSRQMRSTAFRQMTAPCYCHARGYRAFST